MLTRQVPSPDRTIRGWRRAWLGLLVLAWGIQAIVTQSLLLREALVLMFGSELAWGVVLFAWLLGVALGAAVGGWTAERVRRPAIVLVAVLLTLSLAACLELWVFRGARGWLNVEPGELLPLPKIVLTALLFVTPASALVGMAFPLACCLRPEARPRRARGHQPVAHATGSDRQPRPLLQFGQVYALESAGSLIGGAWFSFWAVEHLAPIQTALLCGAVTAGASAGLLAVPTAGRRFPAAAVLLALVALAAALVAGLVGDELHERLVARRWRNIAPGYELVAEAESRYQNLALGRLSNQYSLYCDGQVVADFPDPYTFAPLAHFWLCQHPEPRQVLLLGGGAEGLLAEILRHPIDRLDYVEIDPHQIALLLPHLSGQDRQALNDPRVRVHHTDARYFVKTQHQQFDLVIARLPEPTSALRARLYTDEFYAELRRAMKPRAVVCLLAAAAPGELTPPSRQYLASIRATLRRHFPHIVIGWGHPAQVLAATTPGLIATDPAELTRRYSERNVTSPRFHPAWFDGATDWLDPDKLAARAADLDNAANPAVSTDLRPLIYIQRLVLWEAATSGSGPGRTVGGVIHRLQALRLRDVILALVLLAIVPPAVELLRRGPRQGWPSGIVLLSVGTTGFATMALSIIWLFAFQNLYGYVYQRVGWIIALFMAGLVIGCLLAGRWARSAAGTRAPRSLWRRLIVIDGLLGLLALAAPALLRGLGELQTGPTTFTLVEISVSLAVIATGILGGAAFPLAGRLQLDVSGRTGSATGSVVAADHAGACLGALLCGILLVPIFGTPTAALLLGVMKLLCAALLVPTAAGWAAGGAPPVR